MRNFHKHKSAFTMIELVFIIVVLGILAALALPRMERDLRQEAADNILSAIRYTQHLALNDNKTDPFDATWQKKLWSIRFTISATNPLNTFYTVSSDNNKNGYVNDEECAIDPANGKYMYNAGGATSQIDANESSNIFIGKLYGINNLTLGGGCTTQQVAFDQIGRPHDNIGGASNDYSTYMSSDDCNLTFGSPNFDSDIIITIKKETGYAYIDGQDDS